MTIVWKPTGSLNIASDPTLLPEEGDANLTLSGAISRILNLQLNINGQALLRQGSQAVGAATLSGTSNFIIEQDGVRYVFDGTNIYRNEVSIESSAPGQWWAIRYNQFNDTDEQIFALNGELRKRINGSSIFDWGITAPTIAPTISATGSTGITGSYKARYTYARLVGTTVISESNPSPEPTAAVSLTAQNLRVAFTASSDTQVTHVRIYRTLNGGGVYYFDQDVAIGTVTADSSVGDGSLGAEIASDHDRPPAGSIVIGPSYNGVAFISKGNILHWCLAKQPEYWPAVNFVEVGPPQYPIKAMVIMDGLVHCLTDDAIWLIQGLGDGFNPIRLVSVSKKTPNGFSAVSVQGLGLFHVSLDGIYLFRGGRDTKLSQDTIDPIFRGVNKGGISIFEDDGTSWMHQFGNKLYLHWGIGNMVVLILDTNRMSYYRYDERLYSPATDRRNSRFLTGDNTRRVREIEVERLITDVGASILWEVETKQFGLSVVRQRFEWAKYDIDASLSSNAKGEIFYDTILHQTHTLSGSRDTKFRIIGIGNTKLCSIRLSGTGNTTIHSVAIS